MAKSINIYKSISDYKGGYDERKNISLSLIIDDEEEEIVDSHVKTGFVTFTAEEAGSTIGLAKLSTYQLMEYTTDQVVNPSEMCYPVWKKMDINTVITLANAGDMVHVRGMLSGDNTSDNYTKFKMTGKISSSGNCNALWSCNDLNAPLRQYCGYSIFQGCTSLTTAPELPVTTLASDCYQHMFQDCTSLITAPELPATTLASECYRSMFQSCTSLTTAPELPATTLAISCYQYMFENCTSLTTAPELPSTTLADYCYQGMFFGCTSLTTAPELPATTLASGCYHMMFYGCTSLTKAPELPATTLAGSCYGSMFYGCTSLTTVPSILPATTLRDHCYECMFKNCKSLTTAPELPATTLAICCYQSMFQDCTSLTTVPELPATTLSRYCYSNMFSGCTSLTTAPELPATTLADGCYYYMFAGCTGLTTAPELPATTLSYQCYHSMFSGCTSLTTAPELPATTLAYDCYSGMFQNCTSLTTAPELPATKMEQYCYNGMFYGCSNLNYIKCLATYISATNCTTGWVNGVSPTGTFVKDVNSSWTVGDSGIPTGWVSEDVGIINAVIITAEEAGSTIGLNKLSSYQTLEYRTTDISYWKNMTTSTNITLDNIGDKVYVRGVLSGDNTSSNYTQFKMTGKIAASGNCNSLWNYNDLNAHLKEYCGYYMFSNCTSLTQAPELPATTLVSDCYSCMFSGCSNLNYIKCLATDISAYDCTYNWVNGVSSTGVFVKAQDASWTTGLSDIPSDWTVIEEDIEVVE